MEKDSLTVHFCGTTECEPAERFGPGMRPHYILHMVLKGKGILQKGADIYHLEQGDVFLTLPDEMAYYEADEYDPWQYVWAAFDGENAPELIAGTFLANTCTANPESEKQDRFRERICRMAHDFQSQNYHPQELTGGLLTLLGLLMREEPGVYESTKDEYLDRAKRYIEENYNYDVRIWDLSKYVGIDRSYLYRIFMEREHMSPKQYLTECRLRVAKQMMESGKYTLTETAYSSGFVDMESMEYHFKQCENMAPQEYFYRIQMKKRNK